MFEYDTKKRKIGNDLFWKNDWFLSIVCSWCSRVGARTTKNEQQLEFIHLFLSSPVLSAKWNVQPLYEHCETCVKHALWAVFDVKFDFFFRIMGQRTTLYGTFCLEREINMIIGSNYILWVWHQFVVCIFIEFQNGLLRRTLNRKQLHFDCFVF